MPSPVAHSLIGLTVAAQCFIPPGRPAAVRDSIRRHRWLLLAGVILGNSPDIDYLPGIFTGDLNAYHHFYTHSIGWVFILACGAWLVWRSLRITAGWREFGFCLAASSSHLIADLVTEDGRPPYGIMAFWPFSESYFIAPVTLFMRLHKRDWSEFLQWHNFAAVGWEMALCIPLVMTVLLLKCRGASAKHRL